MKLFFRETESQEDTTTTTTTTTTTKPTTTTTTQETTTRPFIITKDTPTTIRYLESFPIKNTLQVGVNRPALR